MADEEFLKDWGLFKKYDSYKKYINVQTSVLPAMLQNNAGIIGAAAFCDHIKILSEQKIHVINNQHYISFDPRICSGNTLVFKKAYF